MNSNKSKISCKRGFTLIELLVVVLIIGILAAIAMPQYRKAVSKAKSMEAVTLIRSVIPALNVYMLTNNSFPADWTEVDVAIDGAKLSKHKVENDTLTTDNYRYVLIKGRVDADMNSDAPSFLWLSEYATAFTELEPNHIYCYYESDINKPHLESVCSSLGTKVDLEQYPAVSFYKID